MMLNLPHPGILDHVGQRYFGLLFWPSPRRQNSSWSLLFIFLLTGFMGSDARSHHHHRI